MSMDSETEHPYDLRNGVEEPADSLANMREKFHPILGSFIGNRTVEIGEQELDSKENLIGLETKHRAANYIQQWYTHPDLSPLERALGPLNGGRHSVDRINNQFMTKIIPCFIDEDKNAGLQRFQAIIPNTIEEEMVLLTNATQFVDIHTGMHEHLDDSTHEIDECVESNLVEIKKADRMQFSGRDRRSLEYMRENGMTITIDPNNVEALWDAHAQAGGGILPLTEYVKNGKVLGVSGFMGSKVSLAVHDFMDHLWTFDMVEKSGILERYYYMFDSIGNPEATDIYKREGEIVASIAFGVRYFQTMPSAFGPLMRSSKIETHLDELFVDDKLESRHMEAYRTLKSLRKGSIDWQSLGFSFSNYITELDQQRRKYGQIKQRDPRNKHLLGELDPLSPDFICFFIDTHQELMSSKNKHRDDLFRFHILLEEYLTSVSKGDIPQDQPFTIKPSELRTVDFTKTTLPPQRIQWMRNNHGFTATRDAII